MTAAHYLLKQGFFPEGVACLTKGEGLRKEEMKVLWEQLLRDKEISSEEKNRRLDQLLAEDPFHPGALLARGRTVEALKAQERRDGELKNLGPLKDLQQRLMEEAVLGKTPIWEIDYFSGRLAAEEGDPARAVQAFKKVLEMKPNYFPAWVHLKPLLPRNAQGGGEKGIGEILERNIQRYVMDGIVADAWTKDQPWQGFPVWRAPFRLAEKKEAIEFDFSGEPSGAWKIDLDGRFLLAGDGKTSRGSVKTILPPGEHVLKVVSYGAGETEREKKIPFNLSVRFGDQGGSQK